MTVTVTISEARAGLPKLLDAVEAGHEVTITRHGKPVAVLVSSDAHRRQRTTRAFAGAARIHQMIEDGRAQPLREPILDEAYAEELIAEIRAGRDDDPWDRA